MRAGLFRGRRGSRSAVIASNERQEDPRIAQACCLIFDLFPELAMLPEGNTIVLQERVEAEILIALGVRRRPRVTSRAS